LRDTTRDKNAARQRLLNKPNASGALVLTSTQLCTAMLPILRMLPVGGVLLAILILVLALSPRDGSRAPLSSPIVPTRSALVDRDRHAEARQFLIHAALKRADELSRLRELPDTPACSDETQAKLAGLPDNRSDTDPEESGSINETPGISIPTEIGEPSSVELPVASPQEENAPAVKKPEQSKPQRDTRRRAYRARRSKVAASTAQPRPLNLFEILLFGQQSAYISQQAGSQQLYQYQYPPYSNQRAGYQQQQSGLRVSTDRSPAISTALRYPAGRSAAVPATCL
jgi:hypothetical protein